MKKAILLFIVAFMLVFTSCSVNFNVKDVVSDINSADNYYTKGEVAKIYEGEKLCAEIAYNGYEVKKESYSREIIAGVDDNGRPLYETVNYDYIVTVSLEYTFASGFKKNVELDNYSVTGFAGKSFIISADNDSVTVAIDVLLPFNIEYRYRATGLVSAVFVVNMIVAETSDGSIADVESQVVKGAESVLKFGSKMVKTVLIAVAVIGVVLLVGVLVFLLIYSRSRKKKRENGAASQYPPNNAGAQFYGNYYPPQEPAKNPPEGEAAQSGSENDTAPAEAFNSAQPENNADSAQNDDFFTE